MVRFLRRFALGLVALPVLTACTHLPVSLVLRKRTLRLLDVDLRRLKTRFLWSSPRNSAPASPKLHFGSGRRLVPGWLNIDLGPADVSIDLAAAVLPWPDHVFNVAVGQMVLDDLELERELMPLLKELRRTLKPGGVLWVSCPDIEKICQSYLENRCADLVADRQSRWPDFSLGDRPSSHFMNEVFFEIGNNMNLFDFELLKWCLEKAGFERVEKHHERVLLEEFPEFPVRGDDAHALYVRSIAASPGTKPLGKSPDL